MMETLPATNDPAWLPDPDAQWWFQDGHDWRALEDADAMIALLQRAPETKFARGGETRSRSGQAQLFGCWVRPRGATGTGRWMDQEEARRAWTRGEELWWGSGWGGREGVAEEIAPTLGPSAGRTGPPQHPAPPPATFAVEGYAFRRFHVHGKDVWVGPRTKELLTPWQATRKAADLCRHLCTFPQGQHAYILPDLPDPHAPFIHTEDWTNHIRIATLEEVEAYWASETAITNPALTAQPYDVWVEVHTAQRASLKGYLCSVTTGPKGCMLGEMLDNPKAHRFAHFAVEATRVAKDYDKLHKLTSEK